LKTFRRKGAKYAKQKPERETFALLAPLRRKTLKKACPENNTVAARQRPARYIKNTVANPKKMKNPMVSVAKVSSTLEPTAGS
jgi:hypothetical protein